MASKIEKPIDNKRETIRLKCLEMAVSMKISNDVEFIEAKANHFYNWIINGEKK